MSKMNFLRRHFIAHVLIFAALIGLNGCAKKEAISETAGKSGVENIEKELLRSIKQEVYSFKIQGFDKERRRVNWGLEGESARVVLDKVNITNLKAVYYGDDMTFRLFAENAVYDKETHDVELKNDIVGKTSDGGELITDYAKWNSETEEITTDSYVVVKRENISCRGKGVVTKPRLKQVVFSEDVKVTILPDKTITCDGPFSLDHENSVAVFNNNVKIRDNENETFTDRLTVYLDPDTNKILRVVTEGNVKVVHRGDFENMGDFSL